MPARSPGELAAAWIRVLMMDERSCTSLREAARRRVEANYRLAAIASQYNDLYFEVLASRSTDGRN